MGQFRMRDDELLQQFESTTLPHDQWTHRAHVKVAFLYLRDHPFDVALTKMRVGIQKYNAAHQVPDGPLEGYNETMTHALMQLVSATIQVYGTVFTTPDADTFCDTHPQLLSKHILRLFYSPERRLHPDAKARFIEPDLAPLPKVDQE